MHDISTRLRILSCFAALAIGTFLGCKSDPTPVVLECSGECECIPEQNTCKCLGGTDCIIEGGEPGMTLICDGNARCSLECGAECHVECPGTSGCDAAMGPDSTAICDGTGNCDFLCEGDCSVDCPGASSCTVTCPVDAICEITSCDMGLQTCGDGVLACRTACPTAP
jgi:hypothetical protein